MKLFPVVVQDARTKDVLMLAYASSEALKKTRKTKKAWFYSRSRQALWKKGETSGNVLSIEKIRWDCDRDALLYQVGPSGPTCHTGSETCFGARPFSLDLLWDELVKRFTRRPSRSYTARLFSNPALLTEKLCEESAELAEAEEKREVIWEAADLFYFAFVKLASKRISLQEVLRELDRRRFPKNQKR